MKAVITQSISLTPLSSPTIVGRAVLSTVWFRAASSMESISPMNSSTMCCFPSAGSGRWASVGSARWAGAGVMRASSGHGGKG